MKAKLIYNDGAFKVFTDDRDKLIEFCARNKGLVGYGIFKVGEEIESIKIDEKGKIDVKFIEEGQ